MKMRLVLLFSGLVLLPIAAQMRDNQDRTLDCNDRSGDRRQARFCEMREQTLPASGRLEVDGKQNGGVSVKGWRLSMILVRARIDAQADTDSDARSLVSQVRIDTGGNQVRAEGPSTIRRKENWSVSYEIFVPNRTDLDLKAHNGGIAISDVGGRIEFSTVNGGVSLNRLAGNVRGRTVNGGLSVSLEGSRWDGEGLDAQTTNGGVSMSIPAGYSAKLETETMNGGMNINFPITVQGELRKHLAVQLGSGGPTVRAVTTNGGVSIRERSSGGAI